MMAMTATTHIAAPLHHPIASLAAWLRGRLSRRPRPPVETAVAEFVKALDIEALRLALPLDDPDRHLLENPAVEDAFAHLAVDHPAEVATATGMRVADHEQLLLAQHDAWFRHAHPAPEHLWSPEEKAAYHALMATLHRSHSTGGAS